MENVQVKLHLMLHIQLVLVESRLFELEDMPKALSARFQRGCPRNPEENPSAGPRQSCK